MRRLRFALGVLLVCALIPIAVSAQDFGPLDGTWRANEMA